MGHSSLEYVLENGGTLHDIELGTIEILTGRLWQPGLEKFNGGRNPEKEGEWDPVLP